jgi:hypothetical protein
MNRFRSDHGNRAADRGQPAQSERVEKLACEIAGSGANDATLLLQARDAAYAEIDLYNSKVIHAYLQSPCAEQRCSPNEPNFPV